VSVVGSFKEALMRERIAVRYLGKTMTLLGHVKNGRIELDTPVALPEGAIVQIEVTVPAPSPKDVEDTSLAQMLLKYAGKAVGLPPDAARNHDHYLYGTPKK
jgi:hypothetical protein